MQRAAALASNKLLARLEQQSAEGLETERTGNDCGQCDIPHVAKLTRISLLQEIQSKIGDYLNQCTRHQQACGFAGRLSESLGYSLKA